MSDFIILQIAGFYIKIVFEPAEWELIKIFALNQISSYYKNFITRNSKKIDHIIIFREEKKHNFIIQRRKHYINYFTPVTSKKTLTFYQTGLIQFQLVLKYVLQQQLSKTKDGFILHCSAANIHNKASLFLGMSGAGKSTIINILNQNHKFSTLVDDMGIIRNVNGFYFFQTSFIEKNTPTIFQPSKIKIGNLYFIKKSSETKIIKMNLTERIIHEFIRQIFLDKKYVNRQLNNAIKFINQCKNIYYLYFTKESDELISILAKNEQ